MAGPLKGLRVIELEGIGPCPLAGQLMADQGAEVTVISRSAGLPPPHDINSRNKQFLQLNLKTPEGVEAAFELIDRADILIEGFRPGVMERLGLGPDQCHARNPQLIYGRMTGWGQDGPRAMEAGHDITYLATTGALHLMGRADQPPSPPLNLVADYGGGTMFLLFGVLAALYERSRSGLGQVVDAAMIDGVGAMMGIYWSMQALGQWGDHREANLIDGGAPWYGAYETLDGGHIAIGAIEPQFFAEFARLAGLDPALVANRDRKEEWPAQRLAYARLFRSRSRAEWEELFSGADACVMPVLTPMEAREAKQALARHSVVQVGGHDQPAPAPRFSRTAPNRPRPAIAVDHRHGRPPESMPVLSEQEEVAGS